MITLTENQQPKEKKEEKICKNCWYWEPDIRRDRDELVYGYCHRYPPVELVKTDFLDWCGEWQRKEEK